MPTITVTHDYAASPEQVFDAWLDPATVGEWLFATPQGRITQAEIDPRVGGGFTIVRADDMPATHRGEYLELERPRRLVFDFWVEPYSEGQKTRVALDIAQQDAGARLTLTHEGVGDEWEEKTRQGWGMILDRLAEVLPEPSDT
jgi:uncharacterized protein YndB with AHSA1/START domain